MDKILQYLDLFDKYSNGLLADPEKTAFKERLRTDAAFAQEFEYYNTMLAAASDVGQRKLENAILNTSKKLEAKGFFLEESHIDEFLTETDLIETAKEKEREQLLATLDSVEKKLGNKGFFEEENLTSTSNSSSPGKPAVIRWLVNQRAAAAIVLLGLMGLIWLLNKPALNPEFLFAQNYLRDTNEVKTILRELGSIGAFDKDKDKLRKDQLYNALLLYDQNKTAHAITELQQYLQQHPTDETAHFYLGLSLIEKEKYDPAVNELLPLAENRNSNFYLKSNWYLGMTYLKLPEKLSEARNSFIKVIEYGDNHYKNKARLILDEF